MSVTFYRKIHLQSLVHFPAGYVSWPECTLWDFFLGGHCYSSSMDITKCQADWAVSRLFLFLQNLEIFRTLGQTKLTNQPTKVFGNTTGHHINHPNPWKSHAKIWAWLTSLPTPNLSIHQLKTQPRTPQSLPWSSIASASKARKHTWQPTQTSKKTVKRHRFSLHLLGLMASVTHF